MILTTTLLMEIGDGHDCEQDDYKEGNDGG